MKQRKFLFIVCFMCIYIVFTDDINAQICYDTTCCKVSSVLKKENPLLKIQVDYCTVQVGIGDTKYGFSGGNGGVYNITLKAGRYDLYSCTSRVSTCSTGAYQFEVNYQTSKTDFLDVKQRSSNTVATVRYK